MKKWGEEEEDFTEYFEDIYLKRHPNWFNGCVSRAPTTNNCLERFNGTLKQNQTHYERHGLNVFKDDIFEIVSSREYTWEKEPEQFQTTVEIPKNIYERSLNYSKSTVSIYMKREEDCVKFYVRAAESNKKMTIGDVNRFEKHKYKNFDDFKVRAFAMHRMTFPESTVEWSKTCECTCPSFSLKYVCKHVVAIALRLKLLHEPNISYLTYFSTPK